MSSSTAKPVEPTCGACGAAVRPPFRLPASESSPDLDMRPGEPARSTLRKWILTCPVCDACAPDLGRLSQAAMTMMGSPNYSGLRTPRYAVPFLRWALLCPPAERADALLQAAWAADDAKDAANARAFRQQSAACWTEGADPRADLRLIDVLRRAGDMAGAAQRVSAMQASGPDETTARILIFQRDRIVAGDSGRHLLASALPPPAHRPHVATPKRAGGLWSRLFGR